MPNFYANNSKKKKGCPAGVDEFTCCSKEGCKCGNGIKVPGGNVFLCDKTVLLVGGRKNVRDCCRDIVTRNGGCFFHHDGGMEDSKKRLSGIAAKADIVICALDCISHFACQSVKKICKKENKGIVYLKNGDIKNLDDVILKYQ